MSAGDGGGADWILKGWIPIIAALSVWFAHFLISWGAASIWPGQAVAKGINLGVAAIALGALVWLFRRLRSAETSEHHSAFVRRFGLGSVFFAIAGTLFDAAPALIS